MTPPLRASSGTAPSEPQREQWICRDADGAVWITSGEPEWFATAGLGEWLTPNGQARPHSLLAFEYVSRGPHPDIKPGEKRLLSSTPEPRPPAPEEAETERVVGRIMELVHDYGDAVSAGVEPARSEAWLSLLDAVRLAALSSAPAEALPTFSGWVCRDGNGNLWLVAFEPTLDGGQWYRPENGRPSGWSSLNPDLFPEVGLGEKRRATVVLAPPEPNERGTGCKTCGHSRTLHDRSPHKYGCAARNCFCLQFELPAPPSPVPTNV